jgi:nitroreductase
MLTKNLAALDELLTTTRAVRRRLDLNAPVDLDLVRDALQVAVQAPSAGAEQPWRFVVVTDPELRRTVGDLYRAAYLMRDAERPGLVGDSEDVRLLRRVRNSSAYLADVMGKVPVQVVACLTGPPPQAGVGASTARFYASIYPALWSLQLALRARGLGSCLTTVGLNHEHDIASTLDLPEDWTLCGLLPVARTIGTDFSPAARQPLDEVVSWRLAGR